MNEMKKKKLSISDESGFTLMELIVVIGIIVILIALLVPRFSGMTDKANATAAQNDARISLTALSAYATSNDTRPGATFDAGRAAREINKALGASDDGLTGPVGTAIQIDAAARTATLQSTRGTLTYTVTADARQGRITRVVCSGNENDCNSLIDSGLATAYSATIPAVTATPAS